MSERKITKTVKGQYAIDGAGVHLVRVLGNNDLQDFDPFLMLDSFDSKNPDDYIKGFPFHPHRGIETVTYLIEGDIEHQDSLGNKGSIKSGQSQWMTAGSGILHQEMPQPSDHMLGLQLWINLPKDEKMADPAYFDITGDMIRIKESDTAVVRVISGEYEGVKGVEPRHIQATLYDVTVKAGKSLTLPTKTEDNVFIFLIQGDAVIEGKNIDEKTAVLFGSGDAITVKAPDGQDSRFVFFSGKRLDEPVAWGGPIVMNTRDELMHAFEELEEGTFIKHKAIR